MTISTTASIVVYEGNGGTTTFDYDFLIPAQSDVIITYTDADGNETILIPSQYSITGIADPNGGTVTYPLSGSPIANNTFLSIRRELPLTQTTDLVNQDGFYPQVVEDALDTLCMQIQQISTLNSQAIRVPASENPPNELPAAALRANQTLVFDSTGQPTVGSPSNTIVSAAMQPVVSSATLAAGRVALGVGYIPVAVNSNQNVALADITTRYMASGAVFFLLPVSAQVPAGFSFSVYALTADCTITPQGTDTIYGYSPGGGATVSTGQIAEIVTDGAGNWWLATIINTEDFVGAIRPYAGFNEPSAKYVFCDGASYPRATYPACFLATTMEVSGTRTSGSPTISGFTSAQTAKLAAGMLVEGTGIPSGSTILTTPSGGDTSITLNNNATNSGTDPVTVIPFGAADTTHFNVPDTRGRSLAGAELATDEASRLTTTYFGAADRLGRAGGLEDHVLTTAQLAAHSHGVNDPGHTHTAPIDTPFVSTSVTSTGTNPRYVNASSATGSSGTGISIQNAGSGSGHNNVQPTLVVNHLIRVLP